MTFFDDHIDVGQSFEIGPLRGSFLAHHSVNFGLGSDICMSARQDTKTSVEGTLATFPEHWDTPSQLGE